MSKGKDSSSELGKLTKVNLASTESARERAMKKYTGDRGPTTAQSSGRWVDWSGMASALGQPFDTTHIPLNKLEQMRRDPMLAFGLMFVKMPLIRASWRIESTDARRAAFVDNALRSIYGRFILAYCNSLDFGYSAMVKRFERTRPDWKYLDRNDPESLPADVWKDDVDALVWKPFTPLNPRDVSPSWTRKGEFNGIEYKKGAQGQSIFFQDDPPRIELERSLWATNEKDSVFGSLWGYPRVGYAYRYWWAYWYRFGQADRAFERWADPPIIAYHPTDIGLDDQGVALDFTQEALRTAESLRSGANVAVPSDPVESMEGRTTNLRQWEFAQLETKAQFDALNQTFEYLDIQKLRALMVPEQALVEGRGGSSSRNVAAEFGDIFQESQAVIKEEIDDQINRYLIPQILELNFGPGGASCKIKTVGFDPQDVDVMKSLIQVVGQSEPGKLPVDFREILSDLGIPTLSPEAVKKALDAQAEAARALAPAPVEAAAGAPGTPNVGVNGKGFYYDPRERIELSREPYVIERVEDLPVEVEGAVAFFDSDRRTLFVKSDTDMDEVRDYVIGLSDRGSQGISFGEGTMDSEIFSELMGKIEGLEERAALPPGDPTPVQSPNIYVDVMPPEVNVAFNEEKNRGKVKKTLIRDELGNLIKIVEVDETGYKTVKLVKTDAEGNISEISEEAHEESSSRQADAGGQGGPGEEEDEEVREDSDDDA